MLREVKPKNPRTARILKAREPQLIEPPKKTLLLHGSKCPLSLHVTLKTFHSLTKPNSILFHKKNANIHPFEKADNIEFLAGKNDCALVVFGSSNKKRPNCLTMVRIFNEKVLDMFELLLLRSQEDLQRDADGSSATVQEKHREEIQKMQLSIGVGMKPMMLFAGSVWEDSTTAVYSMIKDFFLDMFSGEEANKVDVEGLQFVLMIAAEEPGEGQSPLIHLRWYKVKTKRSGQKLPRVELDPVGPEFDFRVGRVQVADSAMMKLAMKQGKRPNENEKSKKNIGMTTVGDKVGRVHLGRQDLGGLQTRKMKALKRKAGVEGDEDEESDTVMDSDDISEDEFLRKKTKRTTS